MNPNTVDQESRSKGKHRKGLWSPEEDDKLRDYILHHGHGCWSSLPLNAGLQRSGKSCRLRWINYLRPGLKRGAFSLKEEETILSVHRALGNKWSQIAQRLPGRTDNEIKNYWHSYIKKKFVVEPDQPNPELVETSSLKIDQHSSTSDFICSAPTGIPTVTNVSNPEKFISAQESVGALKIDHHSSLSGIPTTDSCGYNPQPNQITSIPRPLTLSNGPTARPNTQDLFFAEWLTLGDTNNMYHNYNFVGDLEYSQSPFNHNLNTQGRFTRYLIDSNVDLINDDVSFSQNKDLFAS